MLIVALTMQKHVDIVGVDTNSVHFFRDVLLFLSSFYSFWLFLTSLEIARLIIVQVGEAQGNQKVFNGK